MKHSLENERLELGRSMMWVLACGALASFGEQEGAVEDHFTKRNFQEEARRNPLSRNGQMSQISQGDVSKRGQSFTGELFEATACVTNPPTRP